MDVWKNIGNEYKRTMTLYDHIKQLLTDYQIYRDSDKKLIWRIWQDQTQCYNGYITYIQFMNAQSPETIRRTRQKVQQDHPELRSSREIQKEKDKKEATKGTFVYREPLQEKLI